GVRADGRDDRTPCGDALVRSGRGPGRGPFAPGCVEGPFRRPGAAHEFRRGRARGRRPEFRRAQHGARRPRSTPRDGRDECPVESLEPHGEVRGVTDPSKPKYKEELAAALTGEDRT